jgi:serine/threonine protein kinase
MIKNGLVLKEQYELQKLLGRGSYGQVWTAIDLTNSAEVAVKIVITIFEII